MKQEWMKNIQDSLCIILNHLLFVAAVITVMDLFQADGPSILLWLAFVVIPFVYFYVTKKTPVLIHPSMFIIILCVLSLVEKIMKASDWEIFYYVIAFVYLIGYFIYYFTKQFLTFLKLNQNTASKIPIADIFQNGIGLTAIFTACSSVILLLCFNFDWVKAIADVIWSGIRLLLSYLFSGMETPPAVPEKEEMAPQNPQMGSAGIADGIAIDSLGWLRDIMLVMVIAGLVVGGILFIYYIYFMIKGRDRAKKDKKANKKLSKNDDVREFCGIERNESRKSAVFVFRNNREKVRRIYQKKIMKHKNKIVGEQEQQLRYLTAKQCCDKLSEQQLKLVYEKARYSEQTISAEDVRLAK